MKINQKAKIWINQTEPSRTKKILQHPSIKNNYKKSDEKIDISISELHKKGASLENLNINFKFNGNLDKKVIGLYSDEYFLPFCFHSDIHIFKKNKNQCFSNKT